VDLQFLPHQRIAPTESRRLAVPARCFHGAGHNHGGDVEFAPGLARRPLPACPAGAQFAGLTRAAVDHAAPCRLVRQERKFAGLTHAAVDHAAPCRLVRQERKFAGLTHAAVDHAAPCRLVRQERKFATLRRLVCYSPSNFFTCQASWQGSSPATTRACLGRAMNELRRLAATVSREPGVAAESRREQGCRQNRPNFA